MNRYFSRGPESLLVKFPNPESVQAISNLKDRLLQAGSRITFPAAMDEVKKGVQTPMNINKPYIELLVDDQPVDRIDFNITISLVPKGMVLVMWDARNMGGKTGECNAKGKLICGGVLLLDKRSEPVQLPGTISRGDGIPII